MPLSIGFSITRYRLWDIDIIIRRTLQYTILSSVLVLIYFSGVIVLQAAARVLTGQGNSPIVTVLITLTIAALFNPLRLRIQDSIDRRFYRNKYDAEKTLTIFAAAAREEVDVDSLVIELQRVVRETMQPEHLSFWLKE
jgi:hypothetical protein